MEYKVKLTFAKELAKGFKLEIATLSALLLATGAAIGYAVGKKQ